MGTMGGTPGRGPVLVLLALVLAAAGLTGLAGVSPAAAADEGPPALHLVTLTGTGTASHRGALPSSYLRIGLLHRQQALLDRVDAPEPVYRWTAALNGFAVRLTPAQADALRADPAVAAVERNAVRPLAGLPAAAAAAGTAAGRVSGGAGVVIGVVDSGLAPDSPLFADVPGLGPEPDGFRGACTPGEDWSRDRCNRKVVGARWWVEGFGRDRLRAAAALSPVDEDGHGTQVASIAAGNSGVSVRVGAHRLGRYGGVAPQARLAVYKACWAAPDPRHDGCASADLVTAVDQAVADGVDVLNLSVGGPARLDTLERALLGAAEAEVVVVGAAGNSGLRHHAGHPSPWVTTVGGTTGPERRGRAALDGGPALVGATSATEVVGPLRLVRAADAAVTGVRRDRARGCAPGSLDAARVAGRVVVCERGGIPRVEKSRAVELADGRGMVLVNTTPASTHADFHHVPTVHLDRAAGRRLSRWLARHPDGRVSLRPSGTARGPVRVLPLSAAGDPTADVVKPDLVAAGRGVLAAAPSAGRAGPWDLAGGSSAATALTSGAAALLLARRDWSAAAIRSALVTTAAPVPGAVLRTGAGRARPDVAGRPGLVHEVGPRDYRRWLAGTLDRDLNTPSILLGAGERTAVRTITNVTGRARYFSSGTRGLGSRVRVTPAAVRLGPGERATYTLRVPPGAGPGDGFVVWRGGGGTVTRVPVVLTRG